MRDVTVTPLSTRAGSIMGLLIAVVAVAGASAIWLGVAVILRSNAGWMAVVVALDAALLLRLAGLRPGARRAIWAIAITLTTIVAAAFLVATARIGMDMGIRPAEAVSKMSLGLSWLWVQSNSGWPEALWVAVAVGVAWRLGR